MIGADYKFVMKQPSFDDQPRRAQNRARTRVALVEALLPLLGQQPLDDIPVSALAKAAGISQATFFNHFPSKADLLTHFLQLWGLRVGALARRIRAEEDSALRAIEALFASTAEQILDGPRVMLEIIAHQARMPPDLVVPPVELTQRLLWLPDEPDVMALSDKGLGGLLPVLVGEAVANGELPPHTNVPSVTLAAASIFFGVPLLVGQTDPASVGPLYQHHLTLLWAGTRATAQLESAR